MPVTPIAESLRPEGGEPLVHDMEEMRHDAVARCWACRTQCQKAFFGHCLEEGGRHLAKDHALVMTDCIAACQVAADSLLRGSPTSPAIAAACAAVCEACAENCDALETEEMRQVAAVCRAAAAACHRLGVGGEA